MKPTKEEMIEKIIDDMGERPFARTWEGEARNMRKILKKHLQQPTKQEAPSGWIENLVNNILLTLDEIIRLKKAMDIERTANGVQIYQDNIISLKKGIRKLIKNLPTENRVCEDCGNPEKDGCACAVASQC